MLVIRIISIAKIEEELKLMRRAITLMLLFATFLIIISNVNNFAFAARKPLQAPSVAIFTPEKYLDETYKINLDSVILEATKLGDANINNAFKSLYKTTRKDKAISIIQSIENGLLQYKETSAELYKDTSSLLSIIKKEVEEGEFNRYHDGIDFQVDMQGGNYVLSWLDDDNKEVVKNVPMPPLMYVILRGEYLPIRKGNNEVYVYRYWVNNGVTSGAKITDLYLENKFSQSYIRSKIESRFGKMSVSFKVSDNAKLSLTYPQGYLNFFVFKFFRIKEETLISFKPGQKNDFPFELEEVDGGIPGIIECFFDLSESDYVPYRKLTSEDPRMALDIFVGLGKGRFNYKGSTIGPVPLPASFEKAKFIDQIITYNAQAIAEGWIENQEVINFTTQGLANIKNSPNNKDQVRLFITALEGYYKANQILSEAYVLLKYNLQYLLLKM
jgi:uncharacterized FlaG/YvyC family protein